LSTSVIGLVLISTFMHAGWNLLSRYHHAELRFYQKMLLICLVVGAVPAVWSEWTARSLTPLAWWCLLGSGVCAGFYLYFLARAYEAADFSVAYPVARSLPVIFVALADVLRGRSLTTPGWVGIFLVAAGCILIPQRSFSDMRLKNYWNIASLWMLLAACGTVGYTILDKIAAEVVQQGPATAARYCYFYFAISLIPYTILISLFKPRHNSSTIREWSMAFVAVVFAFGAYWLVLWALQLSPYAGYIVAFRQFSIVIGAILAFVIYKEGSVKVRLTGVSMLAAGLVLIAGWGRM
jgi:drug/metabolite transporter (DMT)-like permease